MPAGVTSLSALAAAALLAIAGCGESESIIGPNAGDAPEAAAASDIEPAPDPGPPTLTLSRPEGAYPLVWVRRGRDVEVRTEPGGGDVAYVAEKRTEFGSPTVFSVVETRGRWAAVTTPRLANGKLGWVELDPRNLRAGWTKVAIQVDLSERRAVLREDGKPIRSFAVTVGAPGYDTPTGRYAVTDTFRGDLDQGSYGCCALALSATQPTVPSGWLGGNRIAIHGTPGPLGVAESHGCVRAADVDVSALVDRVPLGAPVWIRA